MHAFHDDQLTCVCIGVACRANSGLKGELHAAAVWITITEQHAGTAQQRISFGGLFQACRCACGLLHHRAFIDDLPALRRRGRFQPQSQHPVDRLRNDTRLCKSQVLVCCLNEPFVDRNCAICPRFWVSMLTRVAALAAKQFWRPQHHHRLGQRVLRRCAYTCSRWFCISSQTRQQRCQAAAHLSLSHARGRLVSLPVHVSVRCHAHARARNALQVQQHLGRVT